MQILNATKPKPLSTDASSAIQASGSLTGLSKGAAAGHKGTPRALEEQQAGGVSAVQSAPAYDEASVQDRYPIRNMCERSGADEHHFGHHSGQHFGHHFGQYFGHHFGEHQQEYVLKDGSCADSDGGCAHTGGECADNNGGCAES
jgi:hypothetical protein